MSKTINRQQSVLISGASITGPALAYWLAQYGFKVTIVERAPALRPGGYAVDIRGAAIDVVRRMGILDAVHAADTGSNGLYLIDAKGEPITQMNDAATGNQRGVDVEILREDIGKILYDQSKDKVEYIWADSIAEMTETNEGVAVTFEHAQGRTFDLVIGADGQHSTVRRLTFGDESQFSHSLGCYISISTIPNFLKLDHRQVVYNVPGKTIGAYSARNNSEAKALFVFKSEPLHYDFHDVAAQKKLLTDAIGDEPGWQTPALVRAMQSSPDFYFDSIAQIRMDTWHKGRIALVGDAAYGPSPASGQGTSLAIVGAYVLAGELQAAAGNYEQAFAAYEKEMRPFVEASQKIGLMAADSMIESSAFKLRLRNVMVHVPGLMKYIQWQINNMVKKAANTLVLKDYRALFEQK